MQKRSEKKLKTRISIIEAAFALLNPNRSYSSLGLREIAREAGIAATSFYRHFKDLEELGVSMVAYAKEDLEKVREQGRELIDGGGKWEQLLPLYFDSLSNHPKTYRFILGERSGASPQIRDAIAELKSEYTESLKNYLINDGKTRGKEFAKPEVLASAMINLAFFLGMEFLDADPLKKEQIKRDLAGQLQILTGTGTPNLGPATPSL